MSRLEDDARLRELLAPLDRVEPVTLTEQRRSRRAPFIAAILVVAVLAVGVAIAAGFDPLVGIGAADHAQRPQDVLPAAIVKQLGSPFAPAGAPPVIGTLLPKTSRLLGRLPSGRRIYVAQTSGAKLAIIVTDRRGRLQSVAWGEPLTQTEPVTVLTSVRVKNGPHATTPLSYGIARDGITAVSFTAHGREQTVPVTNNVWFYEGRSNVGASITIHYTNGSTRTITR